MTGFYYDMFNERGSNDPYFNVAMMWGGVQEAVIPGAGIMYTSEDFDRSKAPFLNQVPAVFPEGHGIPPIFLPAQA
jgi:hypothetical protein